MQTGKLLIIIGALLIASGVLLILSGKFPFVGRLPGDIIIKRENFTLFLPITASLVVSAFLSLLFFLFRK